MNTQTVCLPATVAPRTSSVAQTSTPRRIALGEGEVMNWNKIRQGAHFSVVAGHVWVTQAGLPEDYVLGPGQDLRFNCRGSVLAESLLGTATVEFFES